MKPIQYLLIAGGCLAVFLIFRLPRIVVENETSSEIEEHDFSITQEDAAVIADLQAKLEEESLENYVNFADSLAGYYLKYGYLDSAFSVSISSLQRDSSFLNLKRVSSKVYTVFQRSSTTEMAMEYSQAHQEILNRILAIDPNDLQAKTRMGMILVMTQNPMQGVTMLRSVVEEDPTYREAVLNLGLLSMQSGQFESGVSRFTSLLEQDAYDYEAMLYLALCLRETGDEERAKKLLNSVVEAEDADIAVVSAAREYLEEK